MCAFNVAGHDEHPDGSGAAAASFSSPLRRMLSVIKGRKGKISEQTFKRHRNRKTGAGEAAADTRNSY